MSLGERGGHHRKFPNTTRVREEYTKQEPWKDLGVQGEEKNIPFVYKWAKEVELRVGLKW